MFRIKRLDSTTFKISLGLFISVIISPTFKFESGPTDTIITPLLSAESLTDKFKLFITFSGFIFFLLRSMSFLFTNDSSGSSPNLTLTITISFLRQI